MTLFTGKYCRQTIVRYLRRPTHQVDSRLKFMVCSPWTPISNSNVISGRCSNPSVALIDFCFTASVDDTTTQGDPCNLNRRVIGTRSITAS